MCRAIFLERQRRVSENPRTQRRADSGWAQIEFHFKKRFKRKLDADIKVAEDYGILVKMYRQFLLIFVSGAVL